MRHSRHAGSSAPEKGINVNACAVRSTITALGCRSLVNLSINPINLSLMATTPRPSARRLLRHAMIGCFFFLSHHQTSQNGSRQTWLLVASINTSQTHTKMTKSVHWWRHRVRFCAWEDSFPKDMDAQGFFHVGTKSGNKCLGFLYFISLIAPWTTLSFSVSIPVLVKMSEPEMKQKWKDIWDRKETGVKHKLREERTNWKENDMGNSRNKSGIERN